jgi:hypothetical protein
MRIELLGIGLFSCGAILLLAALFIGRLAPDPRATRVRRALRGALAVGGILLIAWTALPYLSRHGSPRTTASTAAAPADAKTDTTGPQIDAVALASAQLAACPLATAPPVPEGSTASREQMSAARIAFQNYDAATNAYAKCVDSAVQRLAGELKGKASAEELQRLEQFGMSAHNTAIDQEQALADRLNSQIRAFKARHP